MKLFNSFLYAHPINFVIGSLLLAGHVQAQFSVTGGDLYVYQIGNNTTAGTAANPIFIDQFNTGGTLLNQVAVNDSATQGAGLVASGQSATEGSLALSPANNALTFMGYSGIAVGTTGVNGQSTAAATGVLYMAVTVALLISRFRTEPLDSSGSSQTNIEE